MKNDFNLDDHKYLTIFCLIIGMISGFYLLIVGIQTITSGHFYYGGDILHSGIEGRFLGLILFIVGLVMIFFLGKGISTLIIKKRSKKKQL